MALSTQWLVNKIGLPVAICCALAFLLAADVFGQRVGDRVVVTTTTETKIRDRVVGRVFAGAIHRITHLEGRWVALENVQGWVPAQFTMSLEDALRRYTARIDDDEEDAHSLAVRGTIYRELGQPERAFVDFNEAIKIQPGNPAHWNNRAIVLASLQRLDAAIIDLTEAIRLEPNYTEAIANRGLMFYSLGQFQRALEDYDRAIELDNSNAWFFVNRGSTHHGLGDLESALRDYDAALDVSPNLADAHLGRANVLFSQDKMTDAARAADLAIRNRPRMAAAHNLRGWIAYHQQDPEKAYQSLTRAIELNPQFAMAYSNRGVVLASQNEFADALADLDRAVELDAEAPLTLTNRGKARFRAGLYALALEDFERAFELAPRVPEVLHGLAWFLATCPEEKYRDGNRAHELATTAAETTSHDDPLMLDALAAAFAEKGDFDEAVNWQKQALEKAPEHLADTLQSRLELYQQNEAYREDTLPYVGDQSDNTRQSDNDNQSFDGNGYLDS